ncbi:cold-shock protein [Halolamina salifodinae]|uniref:Cold shock CspA family protein n=1 Tax=Halolamina salifodinae TaxID=1202767 RepID=A0A8T4H068_9EURY|nr:cold shock CspA family protein [Halolamina salifodinae]
MSAQTKPDDSTASKQHEGTVTFVSEESDLFGFISVDDLEEDAFYHIEDVGLTRATELEEGDEVIVQLDFNGKSPRCTNLELANNPTDLDPNEQLDLEKFERLRRDSQKVLDVTIGVGRLDDDSPQVRLYNYNNRIGIFAYTDGTRSDYWTISRREMEDPYLSEYFENELSGLVNEELLVEVSTNAVGATVERMFEPYEFEYQFVRQ